MGRWLVVELGLYKEIHRPSSGSPYKIMRLNFGNGFNAVETNS